MRLSGSRNNIKYIHYAVDKFRVKVQNDILDIFIQLSIYNYSGLSNYVPSVDFENWVFTTIVLTFLANVLCIFYLSVKVFGSRLKQRNGCVWMISFPMISHQHVIISWYRTVSWGFRRLEVFYDMFVDELEHAQLKQCRSVHF